MANINLTPREMEVLAAVGKFITTSNVDWDAVAGECGFTSAKRARDRWYPLRDKLMLNGKNGDQGSGSSAPSSAKKTPKPRVQGPTSAAKRRHVNEDTPTKNKRGKTFQSAVEDDDEDDDEEDYDSGLRFRGVKDDEDEDLGFKIRGASRKPDGGRGGKGIKQEPMSVDDDEDDESFLH